MHSIDRDDASDAISIILAAAGDGKFSSHF